MFSEVVRGLLAGEVICAISKPEGYAFLSDPANAQDVSAHLQRIELKLAQTQRRSAFYVACLADSTETRKVAKEVFKEIKQVDRPLVYFMDLLMRAMRNDDYLMPGSVIEASKLMAAIDASPSFRNELQSLATMLSPSNDGTDRARLTKILKYFVSHGYLYLTNPERELYQVTGKIELFRETIDFLMEHDSVAAIDDGVPVSEPSLL